MDQELRIRPRHRGMDPHKRRRIELAAVAGVVFVAVGLWAASAIFAAPRTATAPAAVSSSSSSDLAAFGPVTATASVVATAPTASVPATALTSSSAPVEATAPAPASRPKAAAAPVATRVVATAAKFVVVIDAGHQAHADLRLEPIGPGSKIRKPAVAGGTSGVVTHAPESLINLEVALRLRKALEARGITVIMVRTSQKVDIPNSKRALIANAAHAGLFIRLHCDGAKSSSVRGFLTLVPAANSWTRSIVAVSARAGRDIRTAVISATHAVDRGTTPRSDMSGFNWSKVPSVIVEMGVMTNRTEDRELSSAAYQQKLADGMAAGIAQFASGS